MEVAKSMSHTASRASILAGALNEGSQTVVAPLFQETDTYRFYSDLQ